MIKKNIAVFATINAMILESTVMTFFRYVSKRLRDSILSAFFHSYIFAMYKNEALWI